ncbi:prepilin-type N-terminal cleavage/methylation domain-containing protein, partial [Candidatus Sumerlaeota bacterium]|nr:prepilin-type N-terminal cleavage/methylation domain-containing protein [Candidatus Sumerlaeota bacterium]
MAERRGVQKAFTLIELLIVVAIIAILAAIAVPNFVEAQVRSKVSRVKADIRTIAIAMEAYFVDWNAYPRHLDFYYPTPVEQQEPWWRPLTTPVAYMTTFPRDPFYKKVVFRVEAPTATRLAWTGGFIHYDPWYNTWNGIMADTWGPWSGFVPEMRARGFWFVLRTFGPDGDEDIGGTTGD